MTEILSVVISAIATIVVAIIGFRSQRNEKEAKERANELEKAELERNERIEKRAEIRRQESLLSMKLMSATLQLSIVCANCMLERKNNGNVEHAYNAAKEAKDEYDSFMLRVVSNEVGEFEK